MMQLGYYKAPDGNFGDDLNAWLWPRLLPGRFIPTADTVFIGIGSVLDRRFDSFPRKIVMGAGARGPDSVPLIDDSWTVLAVRGPLTASVLGLPPDLAITDPAVLVRKWVQHTEGNDVIGLVPYFRSPLAVWRDLASKCGFQLISPSLQVDDFLAAIRTCKRVLSESLHGAIVADSLRIPWVPLSSLNQELEGDTHSFKWSDWCRSIGVEFEPLVMHPLWSPELGTASMLKHKAKLLVAANRLSRYAARGDFFLSATGVLEDRVDRLTAVIVEFATSLGRCSRSLRQQ